MGVLVLFLVAVVVFLWMFNRSVKAGYGKFLFWLLWMIVSPMVLISLPTWFRPVMPVIAVLWFVVTFGLPLWWGIRWAQRKEMGPR